MSAELATILAEAEPLTLGEALDAIAEYVEEMRHDPSDAPTTLTALLEDIGTWVEAVAVTQAEVRS